MPTALERLEAAARPSPGRRARALERLEGIATPAPMTPESIAQRQMRLEREAMDRARQLTVEDVVAPAREFAEHQAGVTEAHYRNLANLPGVRQSLEAVGLSVDPPSPEDEAAYERQVIDAAAFLAGGAGRVLSGLGKAGLKQLGRGFNTRPGAQAIIDRARHSGTLVEGSKPTTTLGRELAAGSAAGTAVVATPDALVPGDLPEWVESIIGGALPATIFGARGAENLLTQNPGFRRFVMSTSRGGKVSTIIGGLIALALAEGLQSAKGTASQALEYLDSIGESEP